MTDQTPERIWIDRGPNGGWMKRFEKMPDSEHEYIRADLDNPNGPQFKRMRNALSALAFHPAHRDTAMGRRARAVLKSTEDET